MDADFRHRSGAVIERHAGPGFNYCMIDIQAAIGRVQLAGLPASVVRKRELAQRCAEKIAAYSDVAIPAEPAWARANWQSYCVGLPRGRDHQIAVMQHVAAAGIAGRRGILGAHPEAAYAHGTWSCPSGTGRCPCRADRCTRLIESQPAQDRIIQFRCLAPWPNARSSASPMLWPRRAARPG